LKAWISDFNRITGFLSDYQVARVLVKKEKINRLQYGFLSGLTGSSRVLNFPIFFKLGLVPALDSGSICRAGPVSKL
jgi:hypothetical protein